MLTSESMYPLVDQYLDSVSEINSYYLKGEEKIKESLLNEYDKMINPAKDGRKVFHNTILKSAFEIKQNEARRYMHIDYRIQGLNCKLQYPGYYQIDDDKVLQAVAKAGILQEKNIDQMIMEIDNIMNVPVTGTDERMERILEIILQAKDHPQLYKADITRLEKAFGENIGDAKKLNAEFEIYQKGSALACAHVINNFISFLSMSKNENEREARRIHNVHARDEHMMRLSKMKERRNQK